jgi:superfamily II RNA helicase
MSKLFYSGFVDGLDLIDIVGLCASFVDVGKMQDEPVLADVPMSAGLRAVYGELERIIENLKGLEVRRFANAKLDYWMVRSGMIEPLREWLGSEASRSASESVSEETDADQVHIGALCEKYGLFEGNFVKAVLKVSNIIEELVSMSTLMSKTAMLEKLESARSKLVRGLVVPDSLYLHL